ncbi:type II secretion system protein [Candidatus Saccharibacteria bacterium]|nr:type II secretion system protein [Candidatus Saccharibacteria bacterium]
MKKRSLTSGGFTIIELMVCIVAISAITVLALTNIRGVRAEQRDTTRKSDVNAVYYQLEAFHEKSGYYPQTIDAVILKGIDPESLKDSNGNAIGDTDSLYVYVPTGCAEAKCKSFSLSTELEKEAPFIKLSLIR